MLIRLSKGRFSIKIFNPWAWWPTTSSSDSLPLPSSYLQGRCVSHMDDDPFFHLVPFLSRTASLNSWPWHGSGSGTTGVTFRYYWSFLWAGAWHWLVLLATCGRSFSSLKIINNSFHFICFPWTHFENALILNDPIPSVASLDWSDTVKM